MNKFLTILFPAQPPAIYLFIRNILVLGICLYFIIQAVNVWIEYRLQSPSEFFIQAEPNPTRPVRNDPEPREKGDIDIEDIVNRNIFGGNPIEPEEDDSRTKEVDLDDLPLAENLKEFRLIGTIITSDGNSWAIIENTKSKQQELKAVGDRIKKARITKIVRNNVVVNDGQQDAALSIDYKVRTRLQANTSEESREANEDEEDLEQQMVNLEREKVQNALTDFNEILDQARIRPYLEEGISMGMQVSNIQKGSFLDTLQLKDGDILISTESSELNSPQGMLDLVQEIEATDHLQVHIKRNGKDMTLQYRLQ